jgi:acyl-lipid omega-6 desaturase (Delta-12 desaturase)
MYERYPSIHATRDPRAWAPILARYREPNCARSTVELAITVVPFVLLWILMWAALGSGYLVGLLLAVPAAGFLVRLFMIQHDCGHGAFFRRRRANDWVGRIIGVLTLTPYDFWRHSHALHHANSGNLDHRGFGDVDTLTVREFLALSRWRRLLYRLYRNPIVMFGVGPMYLFVLRHRLPGGLMRSGWYFWLSTMATNLAIAVLAATMIWLVGLRPFLLVQVPITLLAGSVGVWLFYIQHQFEDTFWAHDESWNFHLAALQGSSHYDLPNVLRWFTANIGVHHVHHLCSRIPYYRLPRVLRDHPELTPVGRLTLRQSLHCVRMVLWDEGGRRLISFREMHILASAMNGTTVAAPNGRSADLAATQLGKKKIESIDHRVEHAALFAVRRPRPLPLAD